MRKKQLTVLYVYTYYFLQIFLIHINTLKGIEK